MNTHNGSWLLNKLAGIMYEADQRQEKGYDVAPVHEVYEAVMKWWEEYDADRGSSMDARALDPLTQNYADEHAAMLRQDYTGRCPLTGRKVDL